MIGPFHPWCSMSCDSIYNNHWQGPGVAGWGPGQKDEVSTPARGRDTGPTNQAKMHPAYQRCEKNRKVQKLESSWICFNVPARLKISFLLRCKRFAPRDLSSIIFYFSPTTTGSIEGEGIYGDELGIYRYSCRAAC